MTPRRQTLLLAVVCWILVSLPFLVVRIPPITDLPQQMAQIPLLFETLAGTWYSGLSDQAWGGGSAYGPLPWQRLAPAKLVNTSLGGVKGLQEPAIF